MAEDVKKEDEEYEYIEISEGEDLPEGVEYEYVEELEDLAESPKEAVSYSGELVQLRDADVNLDEVLDDILEDKPNKQLSSIPRPPVAGETRVEKRAEPEAEAVTQPQVIFQPEPEPSEEGKASLSSEELLEMAKAAVMSHVERRPEAAPAVVSGQETKVDDTAEPLTVEEDDFNIDGEIEEEMVSMDDLMDQPVNLEDHVIDMGSFPEEPETVIDTLVDEPVVDEMVAADVMTGENQEHEYAGEEVYNDTEFGASAVFKVTDAETVPNGAVMFMGNNGVEFCNGKDAIYLDVENPDGWNLIIFDKKIVSLDEGVKEVTLPKESKAARYATLVKNGREIIDLFNEEKFLFENPSTEVFKGKEHFIYGKIGQTSGLVINDVMTISINKLKGKQVVSQKPMSGLVAGSGAVLYFNGALKIIC